MESVPFHCSPFVIIDQETDDDCIADKVIFTTTRPADVQGIQNIPQIPS